MILGSPAEIRAHTRLGMNTTFGIRTKFRANKNADEAIAAATSDVLDQFNTNLPSFRKYVLAVEKGYQDAYNEFMRTRPNWAGYASGHLAWNIKAYLENVTLTPIPESDYKGSPLRRVMNFNLALTYPLYGDAVAEGRSSGGMNGSGMLLLVDWIRNKQRLGVWRGEDSPSDDKGRMRLARSIVHGQNKGFLQNGYKPTVPDWNKSSSSQFTGEGEIHPTVQSIFNKIFRPKSYALTAAIARELTKK